jgi:hypothetical protein
LHEDESTLRTLSHFAPYTWLSDVGKTVTEVVEEKNAIHRGFMGLVQHAARNPGRN